MSTISNATYEPTLRTKIVLSKHARKREQQRRFPAKLIPLIKLYGEMSHDGQKGIRYFMSEQVVRELTALIGYTKQLELLAGCYIVVAADDPNLVITVAHRH